MVTKLNELINQRDEYDKRIQVLIWKPITISQEEWDRDEIELKAITAKRDELKEIIDKATRRKKKTYRKLANSLDMEVLI